MREISWYTSAQRIILEAYSRRRAAGETMPPKVLLALIRFEDYPWGERRMWPYKMWLKACRDMPAFIDSLERAAAQGTFNLEAHYDRAENRHAPAPETDETPPGQ